MPPFIWAGPSVDTSHHEDLLVASLADLETREYVEHANPVLWRKCYPRIYSEPKSGHYYSPKSCAWELAKMALIEEQETDIESLYGAHDLIAISHLIRFGVPMFWLSDSIAEAIRKTEPPPGAVEWETLPMPFDAACIMLPKGGLIDPESGEDIRFVAYDRIRAEELGVRSRTGVEGGCAIFWAAVGPELKRRTWWIPTAEGLVLNREDLDDMLVDNASTSDAAAHLGAGVAHYILSAILIMNARPELVTSGSLQKRVMKKGNLPREFWTPNIIGEHYRVRRESMDHGGTHASPRFHWVRGCYRQQPYGPGGELRRQQWIEPYMRGLEQSTLNTAPEVPSTPHAITDKV
ncbi:MAG: hypothetical protein M3O31_14400 [Acidobacteriota bacterium]|nr:hypothetical protein [Acidobacteriota bacterium]